MAKDLKEMFKREHLKQDNAMPKGHQARFLKKLESELPKVESKHPFGFWNIAASAVLLLGLGYGAYRFFGDVQPVDPSSDTKMLAVKSLGDVSPDLKKVEDYYVANINLELSSVKLTPDNKELFDGYIERLEALNKEYNRLSLELTESGPNELTVSALVDNLKLRLNLLYRLKNQLNQLNTSEKFQNNG
ncbi:MAG TPA: hypothetical protein PKL92_04065 [Aquaticitalea sp.]|nr:hypothetical protein [Aquaticitalea sp.]HNU59089.1 hypothetical protein [Aquaticitalea sp.]